MKKENKLKEVRNESKAEVLEYFELPNLNEQMQRVKKEFQTKNHNSQVEVNNLVLNG